MVEIDLAKLYEKNKKAILNVLKRLSDHKLATFGLVVILIIILIAIFAPFISPHDPIRTNLDRDLEPPSWTYPLGTDSYGRCLLSQIFHGASLALFVGFILVAIASAIGIPIGLISGYFGGTIDEILMRITDAVWSLPPLVLALAFVIILGPGLTNVIIAIAIVSWAQFARVTRSKVQSLREREFVQAAKARGESNFGILFYEIMPNIISANIVLMTLTLPMAIIRASALSFLGLGAQPPTPEWGLILSTGRAYFRSAPWITTFPGLAIVITVLAFNFVGDGLRDALDPKLKRR